MEKLKINYEKENKEINRLNKQMNGQIILL